MIKSFKNNATEDLFSGEDCPGFPPEIVSRARRKLFAIDAAARLDDLRSPPGNKLHALQGKRSGQHPIRINDQWRVCFRFEEGDAYDVEVCDYH